MRNRFTGFLACLAACHGRGTVLLTGIPDFGDVEEARWVHVVDSTDGGDHHALVWSNTEDWCASWRAGAEAAATLVEEWDGSESDCSDFLDGFAEIRDAYGPTADEGAYLVEVRLPGSPQETTYRTADADGDDPGPMISARIQRSRINPYEWVAEGGYDCGDPDPLSEYLVGFWDEWEVDPGKLEVDTVRTALAAAALEGTIVLPDDDGENAEEAGSVDAHGRFRRCEVEGVDDVLERF